MIVASHQPNFMPYMGFFYKMYLCDVFTFSDTVGFSNRGYHNYNHIANNGKKVKITVPISGRSGTISQVELSQWEYHRVKLWRTLESCYCKAPYFKELAPLFKEVILGSYTHLWELNLELIVLIHTLFGFECKLFLESGLDIKGYTPSEQIADICRKTHCDTYLSGDGAKVYLDEDHLNGECINVIWANYEPLQYGSIENLSVFDYLMHNGAHIPEEWVKAKEALQRG